MNKKLLLSVIILLNIILLPESLHSQTSFTSGVVGLGSGSSNNYSAIAEHPVNGSLYSVWRDGEQTAAVFRLIVWNGNNWDDVGSFTVPTSNLINSFTGEVSLTIGSDGKFHVALKGENSSGGTSNSRGIVYAYSSNGTSWSFENAISFSTPFASKSVDNPVIRVDNNGIVHIGSKYNDDNLISVSPFTFVPVSYAGQSYDRFRAIIHLKRSSTGSWSSSYPYFQGGSSNLIKE